MDFNLLYIISLQKSIRYLYIFATGCKIFKLSPADISLITSSGHTNKIYSRTDEPLSYESHQPIGETVVTGWEAERGILFQAEIARRMETQNAIENAQSDCDFTVDTLDLVAGIADVAAIMDESEEDEDIEWHSDSKVLAEEIRRKEALGMRMG